MKTNPTHHLTMEELDLLLMQQPAPEAAEHAASCERCAQELASMASLFSDLRSTSMAFAATQSERALAQSRRNAEPSGHASLLTSQKHFSWRPIAAFSACAVVMAAIMVPLSHHSASPKIQAAPSVTTASVEPQPLSDEALLNHIQDDLTSTVPDAMEPLAPTSVSNQAQAQTTPRN